jgi:Cupin domain
VVLERLVSNSVSRLLQANIDHVAPNGSSDGLIDHEGEEIGYVLQGALELAVGDVKVVVAKGDSFFFNSSLPHGYRNCGLVEPKVLWINPPRVFDSSCLRSWRLTRGHGGNGTPQISSTSLTARKRSRTLV